MPFSVRCYIFGLVAAAVTVVATLPLSRTPLPLLLALCALVIAAERLSRVQIGTSGWTMSVSLVVILITVLVLPPPGAALVGLISSVPLPRQPSWTWTKQTVNSALSSLAPACGSAVCRLVGGHNPGHFLSFPEFLWPAAAAVTTCLVVNALILAGYVGLATRNRFVDGLRGDIRRATMPYYSSGVLALIFLSLWDDIGWFTAPLVVVPMYIAHWSLSQYAKEGAAHEGTIAALVQAVEIKDSYTRGHSERVARGAEMLAEQLKMPQDRLAMLRFAGLLHDIGKLGVPTRLLTSTGGLTEEEFKLLCMHPNHGVAVLRDIRFLTEVYEGVLYHHERLDGRGYPTGKSGEEIPEFARIIGVADAFDAMTSTRSYRAARSVEEAVAELRRGAGTQFDPDLVHAFENALALAERTGRPWVPTELAPAEPPQGDDTAAAASGPWPLPKRVPGFSFADHDDPFVPVEWFSDWYPSWLLPDAAAIPGQRAPELEPPTAAPDPPAADFDDGWSERMHSAVVRETGPEPDEGWSWDGEPAEDADENENADENDPANTEALPVGAESHPDLELHPDLEPPTAPDAQTAADASAASEPQIDLSPKLENPTSFSAAREPRAEVLAALEQADTDSATTTRAAIDTDSEPAAHSATGSATATGSVTAARASAESATDSERAAHFATGSATGNSSATATGSVTAARASAESAAEPERAAHSATGSATGIGSVTADRAATESEPAPEPTPEPADAPSTRWPVDPGLRGDPRGSMRVRAATPAADPDPRGSRAGDGAPALTADFDLRKPSGPCPGAAISVGAPAEDGDDTVPMPQPKAGDPEAWTPSPEPWVAPEPSGEVSKGGDSGDSAESGEADGRPGASAGPSWFARGAGGASLHFFGPGDAVWPPRDPDARDSEESPA